MKKIINIAVVFTIVIVVALGGGIAYSSDISCLRVPIGAKDREEEILRVLSEKRKIQDVKREYAQRLNDLMHSLNNSIGAVNQSKDNLFYQVDYEKKLSILKRLGEV